MRFSRVLIGALYYGFLIFQAVELLKYLVHGHHSSRIDEHGVRRVL